MSDGKMLDVLVLRAGDVVECVESNRSHFHEGKKYTVNENLDIIGNDGLVYWNLKSGYPSASKFRIVTPTTPAPDYNDGKWHGWNGGECPVHAESLVECAWISGKTSIHRAGSAKWLTEGQSQYCVALRVAKPYKEVREFWANEYPNYISGVHETKKKADTVASHNRVRCIHLREVVE